MNLLPIPLHMDLGGVSSSQISLNLRDLEEALGSSRTPGLGEAPSHQYLNQSSP